MKWSINWIASILTIYISGYYFSYYSSLLRFIKDFGIGETIFIVVLGAGTASLGFGGALLLQTLIMKRDKFKNWIFMITSLLLSMGLCVLIVRKIILILSET